MQNNDTRKKVIYKEKQDEMIHNIYQKIQKLEDEKNCILKKYDKEIQTLKDEKVKIALANYFNIVDSFQVIAYLVSQIEGVNYQKGEDEITLYAHACYAKIVYPYPVSYKLAYLVQDSEKDIASEEIKMKFQLRKRRDLLKDCDYYAISKQLEIPSEHYIQLACFKDFDNKIAYRYKNSIWISEHTYSTGIDAFICDERYYYIIDFMNEVVNYRLEKENFTVSLDEMMQLADAFVLKYRVNRNGKSLNLQKK